MPLRESRNVSLRPEPETLVAQKVAFGWYPSVSERVRAALYARNARERCSDRQTTWAADASDPRRTSFAALPR